MNARRRPLTMTSSSEAGDSRLSPGNEQRDFWGSAAADSKAAAIIVGIKNPAIDKLIDAIIFSKDRAGLTTACKALDRALIWNHYVVPHWYVPYERIARWDRFGQPDKLPDYAIGFPDDLVVG